MQKLKLGQYKHFKGTFAQVIGIAKHTETQDEFVVYEHKEAETDKTILWIRPLKIFMQTVLVDGKKMPRFKYIGKTAEDKE